LWKGVTSVSNAGRKRGRGKGAGRKMIKDLNRGQIIGVGTYSSLIHYSKTLNFAVNAKWSCHMRHNLRQEDKF